VHRCGGCCGQEVGRMRRWVRLAAVAAAVTLAVARCGAPDTGVTSPPPGTPPVSGTPTATSNPPPAAASPAAGVSPGKALVVVEENHSQSSVLSGMPYLASLADSYWSDQDVPGGRAPLAAELPGHHRRIHLRGHRRPTTRRPPRSRCQRAGPGDRQGRERPRPTSRTCPARARWSPAVTTPSNTTRGPISPTRPTAATARTSTYRQALRPAAPCTTTCRPARCPLSGC